jgi:hypothetical protein
MPATRSNITTQTGFAVVIRVLSSGLLKMKYLGYQVVITTESKQFHCRGSIGADRDGWHGTVLESEKRSERVPT